MTATDWSTCWEHSIAGDLCDAKFIKAATDTIKYRFGVHSGLTTLVIESYGGAWLEVRRMTDTKFAIFPVTCTDGTHVYRGDTNKQGQSGVIWEPGNDHAMQVVRARASRMARQANAA